MCSECMHHVWSKRIYNRRRNMDINKICNDILCKFNSIYLDSVITPSMAAEAVPQRAKWVHKGSCGSLLICGGSTGLTGAPCLSAMSALRCGVGLVTVACPSDLNAIFETKLTEAMTLPLECKDGAIAFGARDDIFGKMKKSSALLIGPGLSQTDDIKRLVCDIIENSEIPLILDADALNVISDTPGILAKAKGHCIITPHIGEFARLSSLTTEEIIEDRVNLAQRFAADYGVITVLKSHSTVVATPDGRVYTNILGNSGMATGGTGDVLAGCIASFVSQGKDLVTSALAGVYFHSFAGDIAKEITGEYSLIAGDIIKYLGYAIKATQENFI